MNDRMKTIRLLFSGILMLLLSLLSNLAIAQECDTVVVTENYTEIQRDPAELYVVNIRIPGRFECAVNIQVDEPGYYKIFVEIWNDPDEPNESYYMTLKYPDSTFGQVCDPNLAGHKIVPDTTGIHPTGLVYAGTYFFEAGVNEVILNHYAILANQYPKYWVGPSDTTSIMATGNSVHVTRMAFEKAFDRYDLSLAYSATTDTSLDINGSQEQVVPFGGTYSYEINVQNQGANSANDVTLKTIVADSVQLSGFNIQPDSTIADTLYWFFNEIAPSQQIDITFQSDVRDSLPVTPFELFSESMIIAGCDTNMNNNSADVTVYAIDLFDYFGTDIGLTHSAQTDTSLDINGQSEQVVPIGGIYSYELTVTNLGPKTSDVVLLWFVPPDSTTLSNYNIPPDNMSGDSLFWTFRGLTPTQQVDITFDATVADSLSPVPFLLSSESEVEYLYDLNLANNTSQDSVYAVDFFDFFGADITLTHTAQTDTSVEINGQLEQAEPLGESFSYELIVSNQGPNTASNVELCFLPPDSVTLTNFNIQPSSSSGDTLFWIFDLNQAQQISVTFDATVADSLPITPFQLLSESCVDYPYDTNTTDNIIQNMVYAIDLFDYHGADIALTHTAQTDTTIELSGQTQLAVPAGGTYSNEINVINQGPNTAQNIKLWITIPDSVVFLNFNIPPGSTSGDTLFWMINELDSSQQIDLTFDANVANPIPSLPFPLLAESYVDYLFDTNNANNMAQNLVYAIDPFDFLGADITVSLSAQTSTNIEINGQLEQVEFTGETYTYALNLANQGPNNASDVLIWIVEPDSVQLSNFNIAADSTSGDTLFWTFSELSNSQNVNITFDAEVVESLSFSPFEIVLEVSAIYPFDTNGANNSDQNSVFAIDPIDFFGTDLSVEHVAITEISILLDGQLEQAEFIGESYSYEINLTNLGPKNANEFALQVITPDSTVLFDFNIQPDSTVGDDFFWEFSGINLGQQIDLTFKARIADPLPETPFELSLESNIIYPFDTNTSNNSAQSSVFAIDPFNYFGADIVLSQSAQTDTNLIINGNLEQAETVGSTYFYELILNNLGPNTASNVRLWSIIPDSVQLSNFNIQPSSTSGDTLFWTFTDIGPSQQIEITFAAKVADSIPSTPFELQLQSLVDYKYDPNTSNNSDKNSVYAIDPFSFFGADLALSLAAQTDMTVEIDGQLEKAEFIGGIYSYELNLTNQGLNDAENVILWIITPDSVQLSNFNIPPGTTSGDTLFWTFTDIAMAQQIAITFDAKIKESLPFTPFQLLLAGNVTYPFDNNLSNNTAVSSVYAIDPSGVLNADIAITQSAQTDTSVEINGQLEQAALVGETYSYELNLINQGPNIAKDVVLWFIQPDSVRLFGFNIPPGSISGDTLIWTFNEITTSQQIDITFQSEIASSIPSTPFELLSVSTIEYPFDTNPSNNSAQNTVFAIEPINFFGADIVFTQTVSTDTSLIINGNLEQVEPIGEVYLVELTVGNQGPNTASNVILWVVPPDSVQLFNFNIEPDYTSGDTLFWTFSEVTPTQQIDVTFNAKVADSLPTTPFALDLESNVIYLYDTNPTNNVAENTVFVIQPLNYFGADIALSQSAQTDTSIEIGGQFEQAEFTERPYSYAINLSNQGPHNAIDFIFWTVTPNYAQFSNFNIQPDSTSGDTLFWTFNGLATLQQIDITFQAEISNSIPSEPFEILLESGVDYPYDTDLTNNAAQNSVYAIINPCDNFVAEPPQIEVESTTVAVGDSVRIRVWLPNGVASWEIWVRYTDGSIDRNYAASFIASTPLVERQWIDIEPRFNNTGLLTSAESEVIIFEIRTTDVCNNAATAQATITVMSDDDCLLDRNVFKPESETPLGILFQLSSNRNAKIDLYDVTGYHITKITEGPFNGGWNTYRWNGRAEDGQLVGSGVYVITIRSGIMYCVLKVIIVR